MGSSLKKFLKKDENKNEYIKVYFISNHTKENISYAIHTIAFDVDHPNHILHDRATTVKTGPYLIFPKKANKFVHVGIYCVDWNEEIKIKNNLKHVRIFLLSEHAKEIKPIEGVTDYCIHIKGNNYEIELPKFLNLTSIQELESNPLLLRNAMDNLIRYGI